jgi:hypothetical protein
MQIVRAARGLLPEAARPAVQQLIGGANPARQREALVKHRPIVVVGTPGRLAEMVRGGALQLHRCPLLVLDEADQLLAANFSEDLAHVAAHAGKKVPAGRQTVLVSATLSPSVLQKFEKWCPAPAFITPGGAPTPHLEQGGGGGGGAAGDGGGGPGWGWGARGWEGPASPLAPRGHGSAGGAEGEAGLVPTLPPALRHVYVIADGRHRVDMLRRCVHALGAERALVFMNWQQRLADAQHKLEARSMPVGGTGSGWGWRPTRVGRAQQQSACSSAPAAGMRQPRPPLTLPHPHPPPPSPRSQVACLHGEMGKQSRQSVLEGFGRGDYRVLLVSDVAARGIDVPGAQSTAGQRGGARGGSGPAHYLTPSLSLIPPPPPQASTPCSIWSCPPTPRTTRTAPAAPAAWARPASSSASRRRASASSSSASRRASAFRSRCGPGRGVRGAGARGHRSHGAAGPPCGQPKPPSAHLLASRRRRQPLHPHPQEAHVENGEFIIGPPPPEPPKKKQKRKAASASAAEADDGSAPAAAGGKAKSGQQQRGGGKAAAADEEEEDEYEVLIEEDEAEEDEEAAAARIAARAAAARPKLGRKALEELERFMERERELAGGGAAAAVEGGGAGKGKAAARGSGGGGGGGRGRPRAGAGGGKAAARGA